MVFCVEIFQCCVVLLLWMFCNESVEELMVIGVVLVVRKLTAVMVCCGGCVCDVTVQS